MKQLHIGKQKGTGDPVWYSEEIFNENDPVVYWCGDWSKRTPKELFKECQTILADLATNHPELLES